MYVNTLNVSVLRIIGTVSLDWNYMDYGFLCKCTRSIDKEVQAAILRHYPTLKVASMPLWSDTCATRHARAPRPSSLPALPLCCTSVLKREGLGLRRGQFVWIGCGAADAFADGIAARRFVPQYVSGRFENM